MAWFSASPSPEVCSLLRSLVIVFFRVFPCRTAFIKSPLSERADSGGGEMESRGADGGGPGGRHGGEEVGSGGGALAGGGGGGGGGAMEGI